MKPLQRAICLVLVLAACGSPEPVDEADKALFLRVADLAGLGVRYADPEAGETFTKTKQIDGSYELTYTFQSVAGQRPLYLHGNVTVGLKPSNAETSEGARKIGLLIGFTKNGIEERELPGMHFGNLSLLVKDEAPIGNVFTMRDGNKSHMVVMAGLYVKDPATWQKLMAPKLEQLSRYSTARP